MSRVLALEFREFAITKSETRKIEHPKNDARFLVRFIFF